MPQQNFIFSVVSYLDHSVLILESMKQCFMFSWPAKSVHIGLMINRRRYFWYPFQSWGGGQKGFISLSHYSYDLIINIHYTLENLDLNWLLLSI